MGQPRTHPKEASAPHPGNFGDFLHVCIQYEKRQPKFCMLIKLDVRKIFTGSTTDADRDVFAVSNLVLLHYCVILLCCNGCTDVCLTQQVTNITYSLNKYYLLT